MSLAHSFERLKSEIKKDQTAIKSFHVIHRVGKDPIISFKGLQRLQKDPTYYETLEEQMEYAYYQWLEKLMESFKELTLVTNVNEEGVISHEALQINIAIQIPEKYKNNWTAFIDRQLRKLVGLHASVEAITFHARNFHIIEVVFHLNVGLSKLRKWFNGGTFNNTVYNQWVATLLEVQNTVGIKPGQSNYHTAIYTCPVYQSKIALECMEVEIKHRFS